MSETIRYPVPPAVDTLSDKEQPEVLMVHEATVAAVRQALADVRAEAALVLGESSIAPEGFWSGLIEAFGEALYRDCMSGLRDGARDYVTPKQVLEEARYGREVIALMMDDLIARIEAAVVKAAEEA
jgi:hypothetical protein